MEISCYKDFEPCSVGCPVKKEALETTFRLLPIDLSGNPELIEMETFTRKLSALGLVMEIGDKVEENLVPDNCPRQVSDGYLIVDKG